MRVSGPSVKPNLAWLESLASPTKDPLLGLGLAGLSKDQRQPPSIKDQALHGGGLRRHSPGLPVFIGRAPYIDLY